MSPIAPGAAPSHVMRSRAVARPPVLLLSPRRGWHCLSAVPPTAHQSLVYCCLLLLLFTVTLSCVQEKLHDVKAHIMGMSAAYRQLLEVHSGLSQSSSADIARLRSQLQVCPCLCACVRACACVCAWTSLINTCVGLCVVPVYSHPAGCGGESCECRKEVQRVEGRPAEGLGLDCRRAVGGFHHSHTLSIRA